MHSEHFWPKIMIMALLAYIFGFSIFIYFASSRELDQGARLDLVKNRQKVLCWFKNQIMNLPFIESIWELYFEPKFKYHFMSIIASSRHDFRKPKLTRNWKNTFSHSL